MKKMIPIAAAPYNLKDVFRAAWVINTPAQRPDFARSLEKLYTIRHVLLTGSGAAALLIILKALRELSPKREVVVPAYTAGILVAVIIQAGLRPVICDISLDDFNADRDKFLNAVTADTLAVLLVYMFGIPWHDLTSVCARLPSGVFTIGDCAQAAGSMAYGRPVGIFCDVNFFSFGRGKNFPLYNGGALGINRPELVGPLNRMRLDAASGLFLSAKIFLQNAMFVLAGNPRVYAYAHPFIAGVKDFKISQVISTRAMSGFQQRLGARLCGRQSEFFLNRLRRGKYLLQALRGLSGVRTAEVKENIQPVFMRFPVMFADPKRKAQVQFRLWEAGIESRPLYTRPLHFKYDSGYSAGDFPNAEYLAPRLLTLPVHEKIGQRELDVMVEVIRESV